VDKSSFKGIAIFKCFLGVSVGEIIDPIPFIFIMLIDERSLPFSFVLLNSSEVIGPVSQNIEALRP
jgi:hypothetical protein